MVGLGSELTHKAGPLPVWAWAGLGTLGLGGYLLYRKKQQMNAAANTTSDTQSNVVGAPSNLTTQAEPMPLQLGDTFVNNNISLPNPDQDGGLCPQGLKRNADGTCPPPFPRPPSHSLPTINPAKFPQKVKKNSPLGKTMIKIGCRDVNGHYSGHNVAGHVPVYGLSTATGMFEQGNLALSKGHCDYIPGEFKAYIQ